MTALGLSAVPPDNDAETEGSPSWFAELLHKLRALRVLIIAANVDAIPETELPRWLPYGPGRCGVLVLSRTSQIPLQRTHDALLIELPPMDRLEIGNVLNEHGIREDDAFVDAVLRTTGGNLLNLSCLIEWLRPHKLPLRTQLLDWLANHAIDDATPGLPLGEVLDALPRAASEFLLRVHALIRSSTPDEAARTSLYPDETTQAPWERFRLSAKRVRTIPGHRLWAEVLVRRNILVRLTDGLLMHPLLYEYLHRQPPPPQPTPRRTPRRRRRRRRLHRLAMTA